MAYLVFGAALAALAGLALLDLSIGRGDLRASSPMAQSFLQGFEATPDGGSRRGDGASTIRVAGLWGSSMVEAHLELMARGGPRRIRVFANGSQVADTTLDDVPQIVTFAARTSPPGELLLQIHGGRRDETAYRLIAVRVEQEGTRRIPLGRALRYFAFGGLLGYLAFCVAGAAKAIWLAGCPLLASAGSIAINRVQFLPFLDAAVSALAVAAGIRVLAGGIRAATGMPVWASWPALLITAVRLTAACEPGFRSIDAPWHTHQLVAFKGGQLVESTAPGLARSPYPPALYAAIRPFWSGDYWSDVRLVRVTMMLLEGAIPFLVFAIGVTLGLGLVPAGAAALLVASMPEGVLVLEKGIAANVLGQVATLLCVLVFARRGHRLTQGAALTLLLLSHAPAATLGALLLAWWWALERRDGRVEPRELAFRMALLAAAGLISWLVYYREVSPGFGHPNRAGATVRFLEPHWYRLAKIAQDVVLKFGGIPVVLAVLGLRQLRETPLLRPLGLAWCAITAIFAAVAVLTPFPLRFEYFAVPVVGLLAGALVAVRPRALRWCWWASGLAALIQAALGILWLLGYFDVIAVIMESPRWR